MDAQYIRVLRFVSGLGHLNEPILTWRERLWTAMHAAHPNPADFRCCGFDTPLSKFLEQQEFKRQALERQEYEQQVSAFNHTFNID